MKKIKFLYKTILFLTISFTVIILCLYAYAYFSPKITLNSANAIFMYDNQGELIFQTNNNKKWVNLNDISPDLKDATISIEDKNFYNHFGFDYLRIIKSLYLNVKTKSITAGASTISQQYVKNLYLDFNQTWKRKIEEALLTLNLEVHYTKDEILEGYLNTINYGQGNFGIQSASEYYFDKESKDLTLEEAIILAGIPKSPENYNPVSNYDKCIKRAKVVAASMYKNNYITKEEYDNLFQNEIPIYGKKKTNNMQTLMYYHDAVISELNSIKNVPKDLIKSGGLKVYTNLDINTQKKLDETFIQYKEKDNVELASIITTPKDGKIIALAGGYNYAKSQFNRATQAKRQVGSTIKPFLYYAALNNNMTEASTFKSEVTSFVFGNGENYSPKNYSNTYANKDITMAAALAYSDNIYAVKTHLFLGEDELVKTLKYAGLKTKLNPNPSLALGAEDLNLLDYAEAYNTLANYGTHNELYLIEKIEDNKGNLIYQHKDKSEEVLNKDNIYILNEMMTSTYNPIFNDYMSPTILSLNSRLTKKYAIKSGTTNSDYLIVGYNPDIFMMVWAGNDYNENASSKYSSIIKNIWCDNVEYYLKDKETSWYEPSDNIVAMPLDAITGEYNPKSDKNTLFYFKKGSEPIFAN
ncbi:MAG: transglycosylase domain-containing protein [Tenericutes bacterium]|nr:transglycosylase domain-containing protein [Mycoplasmatota bacterium]